MVDASLYFNVEEIKSELKFLERVILVNSDKAVADTTSYEDFVKDQSDSLETALTGPDDACFWLYSSGSTGKPKGTVHLQHDMLCTSENYGKQVLKVKEDDVCFSAAKLFFAYGLGNGTYFPFSVGATTVLMPERPTPESVYRTIAPASAHYIFRGAHPVWFHAGLGRGIAKGGQALCVCRRSPAGRYFLSLERPV